MFRLPMSIVAHAAVDVLMVKPAKAASARTLVTTAVLQARFVKMDPVLTQK